MDEISQIQSAAEQKLEFLQLLRVDCEGLEARPSLCEVVPQQTSASDSPVPKEETMTERVDWAIKTIKGNHLKLPAALDDLKSSLDVVRTSTVNFEQRKN